MSIKKFYIKEAIKFGWEKMKNNFWIMVAVLVIAWLTTALPTWLQQAAGEKIPTLSFLLVIISIVVQFLISIGLIKIALKLHDNQKPEISDLFLGYSLFLNYLIVSVLYALITIAGLILLIVPGIIWGIKYQFAPYLVIDKGMGPIEAIKKSGRITKGTKWHLFLFGLLGGLINIAGVIALAVGLFATVPTIMVATAFVYRKLLDYPEAATEPKPAIPAPPAPTI